MTSPRAFSSVVWSSSLRLHGNTRRHPLESHLLHCIDLLVKVLLHFPHTPEGAFSDLTQTLRREVESNEYMKIVAELGWKCEKVGTCELTQHFILRDGFPFPSCTISRMVGMVRYSARMSSKKWDDVFIL